MSFFFLWFPLLSPPACTWVCQRSSLSLCMCLCVCVSLSLSLSPSYSLSSPPLPMTHRTNCWTLQHSTTKYHEPIPWQTVSWRDVLDGKRYVHLKQFWILSTLSLSIFFPILTYILELLQVCGTRSWSISPKRWNEFLIILNSSNYKIQLEDSFKETHIIVFITEKDAL